MCAPNIHFVTSMNFVDSGMWSRKEGTTEIWFIGIRKMLLWLLFCALQFSGFSWHHFQWLLQQSSSKNSSEWLMGCSQGGIHWMECLLNKGMKT